MLGRRPIVNVEKFFPSSPIVLKVSGKRAPGPKSPAPSHRKAFPDRPKPWRTHSPLDENGKNNLSRRFDSITTGLGFGVHKPDCATWMPWLRENLGEAGERWIVHPFRGRMWVTFKGEADLLAFDRAFPEEDPPPPPPPLKKSMPR